MATQPLTFGVYPNVSGTIADIIVQNPPALSASGAFTKGQSGTTATATQIPNNGVYDRFDLDASLSSSIYGSSTKVQPKSIQLLIIIKS